MVTYNRCELNYSLNKKFFVKASALVPEITVSEDFSTYFPFDCAKEHWERIRDDLNATGQIHAEFDIDQFGDTFRYHCRIVPYSPQPIVYSISSPGEDNLNLNNLPTEIIRLTIRLGQESSGPMRLMSHRWNSLSVEPLIHRNGLPAIKWLAWGFIYDSNKHYYGAKMRIEEQYIRYFGIESWTCEEVSARDKIVEVKSPISATIDLHTHIDHIDEYRCTRILNRSSNIE
ncbi:hypothetical protein PMAYCL1PPCAC_05136 [Pristionchus mayeri]|uniref:Uncharacterized protein n=1 Tax=Pristionchus mayeri TaxID=1317129 RepID=A0AAN5CBC7_9BILA|nr:hypothetical protein PMAYCL1PPCAC_05136 [Pristionchus mayeri]